METSALEVKVHRIFVMDNGQPLKAFVDICINDALLVKGLTVIEGKKGVFVSMPQEQGKDDQWYDTVRCLNAQTRRMIFEKVLQAYQKETNL